MKDDAIRSGIRRRLLLAGVSAPIVIASGGIAGRQVLAATPACDDGPTPRQTAGPFFTPDSPQRSSLLETGMRGPRLVVTGTVFTTDCQPVAGALLDFWQCDANGEYDNRGYRLRGHQFADAQGRYRLETIVPAPYPGRTRHIHVRVQPRGGRVLTTQLYFPGERLNDRDFIYRPELLMQLAGSEGSFDFVLSTS
jgi:protocatechuate 3,4-dioxygenase beta subunit